MTWLDPVRLYLAASRIRIHLRTYEPQRVTIRRTRQWALQFPEDIRIELMTLAKNLIFISKNQVKDWLVRLNEDILSRLRVDSIEVAEVIYVTTDTAGSSSGVMLNLLRNEAKLQRRKAIFIDHKDAVAIQKTTRELRRGAIVYVDDFAGTGDQFMRTRKHVRDYVAGAFSEFLLLACVCEEAKRRIERAGVEIQSGIVHKKKDRPLLDCSTLLDSGKRARILYVSRKIWGERNAMGYKGLATNVVIYNNAPNSTPLVFRGSLFQEGFFGVVPRVDDLPIPEQRSA